MDVKLGAVGLASLSMAVTFFHRFKEYKHRKEHKSKHVEEVAILSDFVEAIKSCDVEDPPIDDRNDVTVESGKLSDRGDQTMRRRSSNLHADSFNRGDLKVYESEVEADLAVMLETHDVDRRHGFLPWPPPLERLPCTKNGRHDSRVVEKVDFKAKGCDPYELFICWEDLIKQIPSLLAAGQFREEAMRVLGPFPDHLLETDRELRRAMSVLCTIAHAYVWGNSFKTSNDAEKENCDYLKSSSSSSITDSYSSESDSEVDSNRSSLCSSPAPTVDTRERDEVSSGIVQNGELVERANQQRKKRGNSTTRLSLVGPCTLKDNDLSELVLPEIIARPWLAVCKRIGRPPVLSHASYVLDNWRLIDDEDSMEYKASSPIDKSNNHLSGKRQYLITRDNVTALNVFLGGMDEAEFILRTVEIEEVGAIGVIAAVRSHIVLTKIAEASLSISEALPILSVACSDIQCGLEAMTKSMQHLPKRCDPYIFYTRVRPFLSGWKNNPVLPDGLMFEGSGKYRFHGGSAAQSTTLAMFDAILGVQHTSTNFLSEMRDYMPPKHRLLLSKVASTSLRDFARKISDEHFVCAFNKVLGALEAFRNAHLGIVRLYIIKPSKVLNGVKDTAGAKGTGGTNLIDFLKPLRDETIAAKVTS